MTSAAQAGASCLRFAGGRAEAFGVRLSFLALLGSADPRPVNAKAQLQSKAAEGQPPSKTLIMISSVQRPQRSSSISSKKIRMIPTRGFRFGWLASLTLGGLFLATSCSVAANAAKPNVLFILADDFRPDCIAAWGNPHIKTPTLDKLAERGMSFTHAYTMGSMVPAVCTPSRTMILTGRSLFQAAGQNYALWPNALAAGANATFHLGKKGNSFAPGMEAFETCLYTGDLGADQRHEIASEKT